MSAPAGIDPRGPRFGAAITAVLLLVAVWLGIGLASAPIDLEAPGYLLLVIISAIFLWGFLGGVQNHPYGLFFRKLIRPRLKAPEYVESPAGPTFAHSVTKTQLVQEWDMGLMAAIEAEAQAQAICMQTKDFERAYRAFVAKEKPVFQGD